MKKIIFKGKVKPCIEGPDCDGYLKPGSGETMCSSCGGRLTPTSVYEDTDTDKQEALSAAISLVTWGIIILLLLGSLLWAIFF